MSSSRVLRFAPPLAVMALIFVLSAQPDLNTGLGFWDTLLRKLAHMGVFGLLALLWFRALAGLTARPLLAAAAISILYAISDEYHQTFVSGRSGSPLDVGIDAVGVAAAALLARSWFARPALEPERMTPLGSEADARTGVAPLEPGRGGKR